MSPSCEVLIAFWTHLANAVCNNVLAIEYNKTCLSILDLQSPQVKWPLTQLKMWAFLWKVSRQTSKYYPELFMKLLNLSNTGHSGMLVLMVVLSSVSSKLLLWLGLGK